MITARTTVALAVVFAATVTPAHAQFSKTIPGGMKVVTVTVEAVEQASREITVKTPEGKYDVLYVPASIKRFDMVKVGDQITAMYYETLVVQLKPAGEADVDKTTSGLVPTEGRPSGTMSRQRTLTATIKAIDPNVPSITFTGPRDWTYSSRVKDKTALARVKVGDKVDITWTEALVLSLDDGRGETPAK